MSKIHVALVGGAAAPYEEADVRSLWAQGLLRQDAIYWRDGMSDWRPLAEWLPARPAAPPATPPPPPLLQQPQQPQQSQSWQQAPPEPAPALPRVQAANPAVATSPGARRPVYVLPPHGATKLLVVMLWIGLGLGAIRVLVDVTLIGTYGQGLQGVIWDTSKVQDADALESAMSFLFIAYGVVYIVAYLQWIHRAVRNSAGFGATGLACSPGWAIGVHLLPLVNYVMPYVVMRQLWQASGGVQDWAKRRAPATLKLWWGLAVAASALGWVCVLVDADDVAADASLFDLKPLEEAFEVKTGAAAIDLVAALCGMGVCLLERVLVQRIAERQDQLVAGAPDGVQADDD